jgi:hypothetical protein
MPATQPYIESKEQRQLQRLAKCAGVPTLALSIALMSVSSEAWAYRYPGHPQCPWNKPGNNWRDFMLNRYPQPGRPAPFFSIKFSVPMENIVPNRCYTMTYSGGIWGMSGWSLTAKRNVLTNVGGRPADQYQMSVWGIPVTFNEGGELLNASGTVVGRLLCHLGTEC